MEIAPLFRFTGSTDHHEHALTRFQLFFDQSLPSAKVLTDKDISQRIWREHLLREANRLGDLRTISLVRNRRSEMLKVMILPLDRPTVATEVIRSMDSIATNP